MLATGISIEKNAAPINTYEEIVEMENVNRREDLAKIQETMSNAVIKSNKNVTDALTKQNELTEKPTSVIEKNKPHVYDTREQSSMDAMFKNHVLGVY